MISPASQRIASGNATAQTFAVIGSIRSRWAFRNSAANEMWRASSAMWISITRSTGSGIPRPERISAFW
jgi:hypothetical protein